MTHKYRNFVASIFASRSGEKSHTARSVWRSRMRARTDEGALLVEVLVAVMILILVFTTTTITLAHMADQRVQIEQRDRALKILTSIEEESRVFRCGFAVDRSSAPSVKPLLQMAQKCDFAHKYAGTGTGNQLGDQNFEVKEVINENSATQTFYVSIRYWWELGGSTLHQSSCPTISGAHALPIILTRSITVQWREKGKYYSERVIKRDPAPNDNVVFASGNRRNILMGVSPGATAKLEIDEGGVTYDINRIIGNGANGQPTDCAWFPYITPDGGSDRIARVGGTGTSITNDMLSKTAPQDSVIK